MDTFSKAQTSPESARFHLSNQYVRIAISAAQAHEQGSHELQAFLKTQLAYLHPTIGLPTENAEGWLLDFVGTYIARVPDTLDRLQTLLCSSQVYDHGKVLMRIAQAFFCPSSEAPAQHHGLAKLMNEAYVIHRLAEEIHDRLTPPSTNPPPIENMLLANIVIHELLGEDFANQLDLVVHYAVESLLQQDKALNAAQAPVMQTSQTINTQSTECVNCPDFLSQYPIQLHLRNLHTSQDSGQKPAPATTTLGHSRH